QPVRCGILFACPPTAAGPWPGPLNEHGSAPYGVFATKHHPGTRAMTPPQPNPDTDATPDPLRWNRTDTAQALHDFHHSGDPHRSPRPWPRRRQPPALDPLLPVFLESPAGLRFLRRLVLAAHLVFHLAGPAGLRALSRFLHLTQLDHLVGASFGTQQALAV